MIQRFTYMHDVTWALQGRKKARIWLISEQESWFSNLLFFLECSIKALVSDTCKLFRNGDMIKFYACFTNDCNTIQCNTNSTMHRLCSQKKRRIPKPKPHFCNVKESVKIMASYDVFYDIIISQWCLHALCSNDIFLTETNVLAAGFLKFVIFWHSYVVIWWWRLPNEALFSGFGVCACV